MSTNLSKLKILSGAGAQTIQSYLRLGAAEAPKYINKVKDEVVYKKVTDLNNWYTRILGLDEVKLYQERVVALQEKLFLAQERRRDLSQELTQIRKTSTDLQDQIHKVKRNDDLQRFLDLMREETEILKLERDVNANFIECDREEREIFTAFTNAVRDSHEKQRAQLEYTKYFGLILSILGSFLAFCYSSLRKQDLKNFIVDNIALNSQASQHLMDQLQKNEKQEKQVNLDTSTILKQLDDNFNVIIQKLNESKLAELKQGAEKAGMILGNLRDTSGTDKSNILLYGCGAIVGIILLRIIFN